MLRLCMERKAIKNQIGIFAGKQKTYNIQLLNLLFDNEPLTAWELTAKVRKIGRQSLHPTFNKRLRDLEKKGYVYRRKRKWFLAFKGFIAVLIIQKEPKMWNHKWTELYNKGIKKFEEDPDNILGEAKEDFQNLLQELGFLFDDFNAWIELSKKVKQLMDNGVINLDLIKDETLLSVIIMETMGKEELSKLFMDKNK